MPDIKQVTMMEMIQEAEKGQLVIPDFQREFVWTRQQIEELLNSIINGYFIGTILLLESSTNQLRFAPRHIRGVKEYNWKPMSFDKIKYVLDGQQRITSLFYAFFEPNVGLEKDGGFPTKFYLNPTNNEVVGVYRLTDLIRRAIPKDFEKASAKFREIIKQTYGIDIENYPTMGIFKSEESLENYIKANSTLSSDVISKLRELYRKIHEYKIPVVTLEVDASDEDIVNIFERINRTGTKLSIFDLAVARYYPLGIRLNDMKKELKEKHSDIYELLDPEAILKVMALFKGFEPKRSNLLKLVNNSSDSVSAKANFLTDWEESIKWLEKAVQRAKVIYGCGKIKVGKKTTDLIPYSTMLIPMAYMIKQIVEKGGNKILFDKLDYWYWATVFSQRYVHAVDTQTFDDIREMSEWFDNNSTFEVTFSIETIIQEFQKAARSSALAKGFYNQLVLNQPRDLLTGQYLTIEDCQIDHIFPKSKYSEGKDDILNLTIIHRITNQKKGDKLPSEFLNDCLDSHSDDYDKLKQTFASHLISEKGLEAMKDNNLGKFVEARKESFIEKLNEILKKP